MELAENIDWEPLVLLVRLKRELSGTELSVLRNSLEEVLRSRQGLCNCDLTYLWLELTGRECEVEILIEWACARCLNPLIERVTESHPEWVEVISPRRLVTNDVGSQRPVFSTEWVDVPEQTVELEFGDTQLVPEFRISRRCVSVGEFQKFVDQTGYETTAERNGSLVNYRRNARSGGPHQPVVEVSWMDAVTYCRWRRVRLPTEWEWLAAAITIPHLASTNYLLNQGVPRTQTNDLIFESSELTATRQLDGRVIIRHGPKWARSPDWKDLAKRHRHLCTPTEHSVMLGFRVVER